MWLGSIITNPSTLHAFLRSWWMYSSILLLGCSRPRIRWSLSIIDRIYYYSIIFSKVIIVYYRRQCPFMIVRLGLMHWSRWGLCIAHVYRILYFLLIFWGRWGSIRRVVGNFNKCPWSRSWGIHSIRNAWLRTCVLFHVSSREGKDIGSISSLSILSFLMRILSPILGRKKCQPERRTLPNHRRSSSSYQRICPLKWLQAHSTHLLGLVSP